MFRYLWCKANWLTNGWIAPPKLEIVEGNARPKKVVLVHTHPMEDSFSFNLANATEVGLIEGGFQVTRIDLYRAGFQPCLTEDERRQYFQENSYPTPSKDVAPYVDALRDADALVFVYPTWWFNVPAMMKGFIDRVLLPGVAFKLPDASDQDKQKATGLIPGLPNIKKVACVSTYGAPFNIVFLAGDNGRNMISRGLIPLFNNECGLLWLGLYNMDHQTEERRKSFLQEVQNAMKNF